MATITPIPFSAPPGQFDPKFVEIGQEFTLRYIFLNHKLIN